MDVARDALAGMGVIRYATREFRLPGLQRHSDVILKALADFKVSHQGRNYVPLPFAKADDITMEPLRPENFSFTLPFVSAKDNWRQAVALGVNHLIPDNAQVLAGDTVFTLNDDELFIFTDWIDFFPFPNLSAIQGTIDGTTYQPEETRIMMMTDLQLHEMNWPWIADVNIVINAKCEFAGISEFVPFGVHICKGRLLSGLT
jgi:hypothetical protein